MSRGQQPRPTGKGAVVQSRAPTFDAKDEVSGGVTFVLVVFQPPAAADRRAVTRAQEGRPGRRTTSANSLYSVDYLVGRPAQNPGGGLANALWSARASIMSACVSGTLETVPESAVWDLTCQIRRRLALETFEESVFTPSVRVPAACLVYFFFQHFSMLRASTSGGSVLKRPEAIQMSRVLRIAQITDCTAIPNSLRDALKTSGHLQSH